MKRLLIIATAAGLAGCTATIDLRYAPQHPAAYVPGSDSVALFVAPVEDPSGRVQFAAYNAGVVKFQYPRPMAEGVREALKVEAKRDGFPVVSTEEQADAVLRATLTAAQITVSNVTQLTMASDATVLLDAALEDRVSRRRAWAGSVEGRARITRGGGYDPGEFGSLLSTALGEAVTRLGSVLAQADLSKLKSNAPAAAAKAPSIAPAPAGANDVDVPEPNVPATHPHFYAVVIGVGRYRKHLPTADFADADATMVSRYVAGYGVPGQNIVTLLNDEAGRSDFEKYFEKWLPNHVEPDSVVFVYFSGHGAPNPKTGDAYLVPYDGDPLYLEETAYPLKKLYAQLAKLPTDKVTVVLDSCFSGAGGRSVIAAGARPLVNVVQTAAPGKITVISAAAAEQTSNAYRDKGHGLFTYYFLKGLQIKKDDIRGVFEYLKPQVSAYARRELNTEQEPQWQGK